MKISGFPMECPALELIVSSTIYTSDLVFVQNSKFIMSKMHLIFHSLFYMCTSTGAAT